MVEKPAYKQCLAHCVGISPFRTVPTAPRGPKKEHGFEARQLARVVMSAYNRLLAAKKIHSLPLAEVYPPILMKEYTDSATDHAFVSFCQYTPRRTYWKKESKDNRSVKYYLIDEWEFHLPFLARSDWTASDLESLLNCIGEFYGVGLYRPTSSGSNGKFKSLEITEVVKNGNG